jgi:opacity protein-like surface antigen
MRGFIIIIIQWYITMKKAFSLLALSAVASSAFAQDDNWYVGLDVLHTSLKDTNSVSIKNQPLVESSSVQAYGFDKELGFSLNAGREFDLDHNFAVAVEAEYISFGNFSGREKGHVKEVGESNKTYDSNLNLKVKAININIKPKYHFGESGFYAGAILGFGSTKVKSDSDIGINYGLEAGYEINNQWNISTGYRVHKVSSEQNIDGIRLEDLDIEMNSLYLGLDYKF